MKKITILAAFIMAIAGSAYATDFSELQTLKAADVESAVVGVGSTSPKLMQAAPHFPLALLPSAVPVSSSPSVELYHPLTHNTDICDKDVAGLAQPLLSQGIAVLVAPATALALPSAPLNNVCHGGISLISANTLIGIPSRDWVEVISGEITIMEVQSLVNSFRAPGAKTAEVLEMAMINSSTVSYSIKISPWVK